MSKLSFTARQLLEELARGATLTVFDNGKHARLRPPEEQGYGMYARVAPIHVVRMLHRKGFLIRGFTAGRYSYWNLALTELGREALKGP